MYVFVPTFRTVARKYRWYQSRTRFVPTQGEIAQKHCGDNERGPTAIRTRGDIQKCERSGPEDCNASKEAVTKVITGSEPTNNLLDNVAMKCFNPHVVEGGGFSDNEGGLFPLRVPGRSVIGVASRVVFPVRPNRKLWMVGRVRGAASILPMR